MITTQERAAVAQLLGREPRGLEAIARASADGSPMVIRVGSLVEDTPFPTLFWLVDRSLSYRIDQAEAGGLIRQFQRLINADQQLQRCMVADHRAHIALRDAYISPAERQRLAQLGFAQVLQHRGIGGIADPKRIRCLHTWYAAHLIVPNTIGKMLDSWWAEQAAGKPTPAAAGGEPDLADTRVEPGLQPGRSAGDHQ